MSTNIKRKLQPTNQPFLFLQEQAAKKLAKMEVSGVSLHNIVSGGRSRRTKKDVNYSNFVYDTMDFEEEQQ